jgi:hypothetical protein
MLMTNSTVPSQDIIDQFVGNAHGNFTVVKELLEKYPALLNANASWDEHAIEPQHKPKRATVESY